VDGVVTHGAAQYNESVVKRLATALALLALAGLAALALVPLRQPRPREAPRVVSAASAAGALQAGAATAAIEVAPGTPIAGYPRLLWASQGVRDAPAAHALAFREGGLTVAIASADILLVPPELRRRVESRLADLKLGALLLAATHTHSGPGGYWDDFLGGRIATGPYHRRHEEAVAAAVEAAVRGAVTSLGPARLAVGSARLQALSRNRNGGEVDGRLLVLRATRAGDVAAPGRALAPAEVGGAPPSVIGQVVVLPAHATILSSRNRLLSSDWPGALARELPGTTVFLQGAIGDQSVQREGGVPDPETYARSLAAEIARLPFGPADAAPPLGAALAEVALPAPSFGAVPRVLDRLASNLLHDWLPARASVLAIRAGPALLAAVPAEPGGEVGRRWRAALGPDAEVVSLAGGYLGYVETPQKVRDRSGESVRTYLGPDLAFVLGDGLVVAAGALSAAPSGGPDAPPLVPAGGTRR
jgi:hypothetical protein